MKKILVWDPRSPQAAPVRVEVSDIVASAIVRAGYAAPVDPRDAGELDNGDALDSAMPTDILIWSGPFREVTHIVVPRAAAIAAVTAGEAVLPVMWGGAAGPYEPDVTRPGAMTITSITPGAGSLVITVEEGDPGDAPITEHQIQISFDGEEFFLFAIRSPADTHILSGLAGFPETYVRVAAVNAGGPGADSNIVSAVPGPVVPSAGTLALEAGVGEIIARPTSGFDGGGAITARVFRVGETAETLVEQEPVAVEEDYSFPFLGVTTRFFSFADVNSAGIGAFSEVVSATTLADAAVPGAFTSPMWALRNIGNGTSLLADINSLPATNGSALIRIEYSLDGGITPVSSGGLIDFEIGALTTGAPQGVRIRVVNGVGAGPWSDVKTLAPTVEADGMTLAIEPGGFQSWALAKPWLNLMWYGGSWQKDSASDPSLVSQSRGTLVTQAPTDRFRMKLVENSASVANVRPGMWRIFNPSGAKLRMQTNTGSPLTDWSTAETIDFNYGGTTGLWLWAEGNVTNDNGPIRIVHHDFLDDWAAGKVFDPDFLNFLSLSKARALRFMVWLSTNPGRITDWSQRPLVSDICWPQSSMVPYELVCQLANELGVPPYICTPAMATNDYIDSMFLCIRDNLDPSLPVYNENGNEIEWNNGVDFLWNSRYYLYYEFTHRYAARVTGENYWYLAGHGLTDGSQAVPFSGFTHNLWEGPNTIQVIDADHFRLIRPGGSVNVPEASTGRFVWLSEPGKISRPKHSFGVQSLNSWTRGDAVLGRERMIHVLGSWIASPSSYTGGRLSAPGVREATDMVVVANYVGVYYWTVKLEAAGLDILPSFWHGKPGAAAAATVKVSLYAPGASPTPFEAENGIGEGFIAQRTIAFPSSQNAYYPADTAFTGLTDGLTYVVAASYAGGARFATGTFTPGTSTKVMLFEDDADFIARLDAKQIENCASIEQHVEIADGIPVGLYETNNDFHLNGGGFPDDVKNKLRALVLTEPYVQHSVTRNLHQLAASGVKWASWFVDIGAWRGLFDIAESYADTSSPRFAAFASHEGLVPKRTRIAVPETIALPDVTVEPASYPHVVGSLGLPDGASIRLTGSGNTRRAFDVVDGDLVMLHGDYFDFDAPVLNALEAIVTDGYTARKTSISVALGGAWYPADASYVWTPIEDDDTAAVNPLRGGALALSGTAATYDSASHLWKFNANGRYVNTSSAFAADVRKETPLLIAMVLDKDSHNASFTRTIARFGNVRSGIVFERTGSNQMRARWVDTGGSINGASGGFDAALRCHDAMPAGKHVYWGFADAEGRLAAGHDQIVNQGPSTNLYTHSGNFPRELDIGGTSSASESSMKHGSVLIVSRAGMDLAAAMDIVAALAAHEGISA